MQTVLTSSITTNLTSERGRMVFGEKISLIGKLFGCWHKDLSRPFTVEKFSYCACLDCGARKPFDADKMKTFGSFYYPPATAFVKK